MRIFFPKKLAYIKRQNPKSYKFPLFLRKSSGKHLLFETSYCSKWQFSKKRISSAFNDLRNISISTRKLQFSTFIGSQLLLWTAMCSKLVLSRATVTQGTQESGSSHPPSPSHDISQSCSYTLGPRHTTSAPDRVGLG